MDVELVGMDDDVEGADDKIDEAEEAKEAKEAGESKGADEADTEVESSDDETVVEMDEGASMCTALVLAASAVTSSVPLDDASVDETLAVGAGLSRAAGSTTPAF